MSELRVGIVMPLAEARGGAERMLMHLLRTHSPVRTGICYSLAFLERGPLCRETSELGYSVTLIPTGPLRHVGRGLAAVLRLARWARSRDMLLSWFPKAHLYAGAAAWLTRRHAVWWQHGMTEGGWMDRWACRLPAARVLCCSEAVAEAQAGVPGSPPCRVVHPAYDVERFDPERLPEPARCRELLGLPASGLLYGTVARLQPGKGVDHFLQAAALVARRDPEAQFVIVGGPEPRQPGHAEQVWRLAGVEELAGRVRFAGAQADPAPWVQAMDVLVLAAAQPEGFGMALLEGLALGKPVVAANAGGPARWLEDGEDSLLVAPGDAHSLAEALLELRRPELRGRLGRAGRRTARRYTPERLAGTLAEELRAAFLAAEWRRAVPRERTA